MEQSIQEGNRIIAEFDGWKFIKWCGEDDQEKLPLYQKFDKDGTCVHAGIFHAPEYHDNWNAIMRVVEKIEQTCKTVIAISDWGAKHYMNIITGVGVMNATLDNPSKFMGQGKTKKEAVLDAVIQYINWYNQTKS